jgi:hypothetical protein
LHVFLCKASAESEHSNQPDRKATRFDAFDNGWPGHQYFQETFFFCKAA